MSDYRCSICGEYYPEYFEDTKHDGFCDRCEDIMNYWLDQLFDDLKTTMKAQKGKDFTKNDFEKALIDFIGW